MVCRVEQRLELDTQDMVRRYVAVVVCVGTTADEVASAVSP